MIKIPQGNDALFSIFVHYQASEVVATNGMLLSSAPRSAVNLREVENLAVKVLHLFTSKAVALPYSISQDRSNMLLVEFPEGEQAKGEYALIIEFDVSAPSLEDKLLHRKIQLPLCQIVDTMELGKLYTANIVAEVMPLVQGAKGDKGETPTFSLKKDPSNGKTYIAVGDDFLRDEEGNRAYIQREVTRTIDYAPAINLKPRWAGGWNDAMAYGYMESARSQLYGSYTTLTSASQIRNNNDLGNTIATPFAPPIKDGFYNYGMYAHLDYPSSQPIWEAMRSEYRLFAFVLRIETYTDGRVSMTNSADTVYLETKAHEVYDLAIPIMANSGRTRLEIITPFMEEAGRVNFFIHDARFIDITANPEGLRNHYV